MMEYGREVVAEVKTKAAKNTDNVVPKLTDNDIESVIDIVCKLQGATNEGHVKVLLQNLGTLLGVDGCVLGVHNHGEGKSNIIGTTVDGNLLPEFELNRYPHGLSGSFSKHTGDGEFFFFFNNGGDNLYCFLCIKTSSTRLQSRQMNILNFMLPYVYSVVNKLHTRSLKRSECCLTNREHEVMQWIVEGKDNWSISRILGVSERTVKFHNCNIYKKLGVNTKAELVRLYYKIYLSELFVVEDKTFV